MKKKVIILTVLVATMIFYQSLLLLPWWTFCIVLFLLGVILPNAAWKSKPFNTGFLIGFLSWILPHLYFELTLDGNVMSRVADLFSIPQFLIVIAVGLIGGLLAGLSFYSGAELRKGKAKMQLEIEAE